MDIFYSIGVAQILFSLLLIWKKGETIIADHILMLLLVSFGLELGYSWLNLCYIPSLPNLILFPFLFGPLLYMYTQLMTSEKPRIRKDSLPHLIPFVVFTSLALIFPHSIYKFKFPYIKHEDNSWFHVANFICFIISMLVYWRKITRLLKRHQKNVLDQFSEDTDVINLSWIYYLAIFIFAGFIISVAFDLVISFTGFSFLKSVIPLHIGILLATYSLSFFGFRQEAIFEEQKFERFQTEPVVEENKPESVSEKELLMQFLVKEKPHLRRNLTLKDLADQLSMPTYRLSELINNELEKNFFTLINELRVEEAKQRISSGEYSNLTLSAIGFDSGFNSKSTFQALFKKFTGMTPSQYKKAMSEG